MKVELTARGGGKITVDREGLKALVELLAEVGEQGHGCQSDGSLPEVVLVDEAGKVMLPARKAKPQPTNEVSEAVPVTGYLSTGTDVCQASDLEEPIKTVPTSPGFVLKSVDVSKASRPSKAPAEAKVG